MRAACVGVAYSGGRDSTALLHATLAAAEAIGVQVLALHVHHGLSPHADDWMARCAAQCQRWARRGRPVRFVAERITSRPQRGDSLEAWARDQRYAALHRMAMDHGIPMVLLGQHRRDQAETVLLQALRGAGVAGLAGMPRVVERDGIVWARPWLDRPREQIEAYLRRHRLRHVDDDSNDDLRLDRNRLRARVWPALLEAFPQAETALAASASWAHQATTCLDELAALDLAQVSVDGAIDLAAWCALTEARRGNALRAWLRQQLGAPAAATLVGRLMAELAPRRTARWPTDRGELRGYRGRLSFQVANPARKEAGAPLDIEPGPARESVLQIRSAGPHPLPGWGGRLDVEAVKQGGIPFAWLARLELRARTGGERFQAGLERPPRSLKKQYQAAAVPAWERDGPLLYSGGQLVYVPGLGLDARLIGLPGQPQVTLRWVPTRPG